MVDTTDFALYKNFGAYTDFPPECYSLFNVKRGLRNPDGTGVVAGVTSISNVHGYLTDEGVKVPDKGRLTLRGYDINDLVRSAVEEDRFGYEELAFLLWDGDLPSRRDLDTLNAMIDERRDLPDNFVANLIMNSPSANTMNMLARSVLLLYSYDENADVISKEHEIDVAIQMVSRLPRLAVLSYLARKQVSSRRMYINPPLPGLSTAETILTMLRPDMEYTHREAKMLDIMLMLHAEHGGGNNSTFTTRVLSSSGTDAYSAYAGGISSLKGPKHGGANLKVMNMRKDLKENVQDWSDEGQVADYLTRVLNKEANDHTGLIYGMGHAVYTLSDPRAQICKEFARRMVKDTEFEADLMLLETIERLTPELFATVKGSNKAICANIDMYSGLVYQALGIPEQLYTALFAVARQAGWSAHRFEELASGRRIIRPAYKSFEGHRDYVPIDKRESASDITSSDTINVSEDVPND